MEKAYDLNALGEKLKARGLDVAEDMARVIVEELFDWLAESAILSETPYDNLLAPVYPMAKKAALDQVDKIDGKEDSGD